jgi:hypothetical protein
MTLKLITVQSGLEFTTITYWKVYTLKEIENIGGKRGIVVQVENDHFSHQNRRSPPHINPSIIINDF